MQAPVYEAGCRGSTPRREAEKFSRPCPRPGGSRSERPKLVVRVQLPAGVLRLRASSSDARGIQRETRSERRTQWLTRDYFRAPARLRPADTMNEARRTRLRVLARARARAVRRDGHVLRNTFYANDEGAARQGARARVEGRRPSSSRRPPSTPRARLHEGHAGVLGRVPRGEGRRAARGGLPARHRQRQDAPQLRPDRSVWRGGP